MPRFHKFSDPNLLLECDDSGNPVAIRNKNGARAAVGGDNPISLPALSNYSEPLNLTVISDLTWIPTVSAGCTAATDSAHAKVGAETLKLFTVASAGLNAYGTTTFAAKDLSTYDFIEFVVFADFFDEISPTVLGLFLFTDATNYFSLNNQIRKPGWNIIRLAKSAFTATLSPSWASITQIRLRLNSSASSVRTIYFAEVNAIKSASQRAVLSLAFDDGDKTAIFAARYLASRGIRATFFIIRALLDTPNFLTTQQLQEIAGMGHEIGLHGGYGGYDNWRDEIIGKGFSAFVSGLKADRDYLLDYGLNPEVASFPQGLFVKDQMVLDYENDDLTKALRDVGIKFIRSTNNIWGSITNNYSHYKENYSRTGLLISGGLTLSNGNNLATVQAAVDSIINLGGWHNFYGHALAATAADSVTWATTDFITLIDYLVSKNRAGLLDIRAFGDVAQELNRLGYLTTMVEN